MANTCAGANKAAFPRPSLSMFVAAVLVMGLVTSLDGQVSSRPGTA